MKITNDYKKRRGQIKSFPTGEIIEPSRKYLEIYSFCISSNFWYLEGILVKSQESKYKQRICKKRPLIRGLLWFYQIKCFLVSTVSVKPLLHTPLNYVIKLFFVEGLNGMLFNCHMCQFSIS